MNIGLFGGTFDPVHRGHLALAQAAEEKFRLREIHFVPANIPPHKRKLPLTSFPHRFAMLALATEGKKNWISSLLEAPSEDVESKVARPSYSIETVRKLKLSLKKTDQVFFLVGIDAFLDIAKWHQSEAIFAECAFIVASRPGHSLADVANALPESLRPKAETTQPFQRYPAKGDLLLPGVTVHLLEGLHQAVSATAIRAAAAAGKPLGKTTGPAVAEYIKKQDLYR